MAHTKNTPKRTGKALSMQDRFPRTIAIDLYDAWQILKRSGDPIKICKITGLSRPVVDRCLNYGHVKNTWVADKITRFFNERVEKEKAKGKELLVAAKSA